MVALVSSRIRGDGVIHTELELVKLDGCLVGSRVTLFALLKACWPPSITLRATAFTEHLPILHVHRHVSQESNCHIGLLYQRIGICQIRCPSQESNLLISDHRRYYSKHKEFLAVCAVH